MMSTVLGISVAYVVLGVVLLLMGLTSRVHWRWKSAAIIVSSVFFVAVFFQTRGLLGWPGIGKLPDRFQLLSVRVVEPDRKIGDAGSIYLWVEEIDENNIPVGIPRSFRIPYSKPLAEKSQKARDAIMEGNQIAGTAEDIEGQTASRDDKKDSENPENKTPLEGTERAEDGHARIDMDELLQKMQKVEFQPMPAALMPVKKPQ